MQEFPRDSKKDAVLGEIKKSLFEGFGSPAPSGVFRGTTLRNVITASLGNLFSLDHKEESFPGQWPPNGLDLTYTIGTQRIEAHTDLFGDQVLCQLGLQEDQFLPGQETLKERILRPCPVSQQDLMHFGAPFIIRNVVGDGVTGGLAVGPGCLSHGQLPQEQWWVLLNLLC